MTDAPLTLPASAMLVSFIAVAVGSVLFGYGIISWALSIHGPAMVGGALMIAGAAVSVAVLGVMSLEGAA